MAEEPFDGCIKCHSNDRAEQPKISMLTTEILCKNKQNKKKVLFPFALQYICPRASLLHH